MTPDPMLAPLALLALAVVVSLWWRARGKGQGL